MVIFSSGSLILLILVIKRKLPSLARKGLGLVLNAGALLYFGHAISEAAHKLCDQIDLPFRPIECLLAIIDSLAQRSGRFVCFCPCKDKNFMPPPVDRLRVF